MNQELNDLIKLGKYAGGRLDLVQAAGGNASVKLDDTKMLVTQAWGYTLSETEAHCGYVCVNAPKIADVLTNEVMLSQPTLKVKNTIANELVKDANESPDIKPTAEVFLHALLPFKVALHLHPMVVNSIMVCQDAQAIINQLLPDAGFVDFATPGLEVSILFRQYIDGLKAQGKKIPHIIFMKNHGLMIGDDSVTRLTEKVEIMLNVIEAYLNVDNSHFRVATKIASLFEALTDVKPIAYLSGDQTINQAYQTNRQNFFAKPSYPDFFIYNGHCPLEIKSLDIQALLSFKEHYGVLPKVVVYQGHIYFIAKNITKAKEMEDVFKSQLCLLSHIHGKQVDFLNQAQIDEITF